MGPDADNAFGFAKLNIVSKNDKSSNEDIVEDFECLDDDSENET